MDQEYELQQYIGPDGAVKLTTQGSMEEYARLPQLEVVIEEDTNTSMPLMTNSESDCTGDLTVTPILNKSYQKQLAEQKPIADLLNHKKPGSSTAVPANDYRSYMSDFDPTRELHLCWQDTIEEVSLEDEEYFSSAESIKVKSTMNREKATSSRKSMPHGDNASKNNKPSQKNQAATSSYKLIMPKSNFTKISKSCKSRGKPNDSASGSGKVRTAYNAYSSTSRLSGHSNSGKTLRKTSGSMQTTAASASISHTEQISTNSTDAILVYH